MRGGIYLAMYFQWCILSKRDANMPWWDESRVACKSTADSAAITQSRSSRLRRGTLYRALCAQSMTILRHADWSIHEVDSSDLSHTSSTRNTASRTHTWLSRRIASAHSAARLQHGTSFLVGNDHLRADSYRSVPQLRWCSLRATRMAARTKQLLSLKIHGCHMQ